MDEKLDRTLSNIRTTLETLTASNLALIRMLEARDLLDPEKFLKSYQYNLILIKDNQWLYENITRLEDEMLGYQGK